MVRQLASRAHPADAEVARLTLTIRAVLGPLVLRAPTPAVAREIEPRLLGDEGGRWRGGIARRKALRWSDELMAAS